jgi:hypothetical protein
MWGRRKSSEGPYGTTQQDDKGTRLDRCGEDLLVHVALLHPLQALTQGRIRVDAADVDWA